MLSLTAPAAAAQRHSCVGGRPCNSLRQHCQPKRNKQAAAAAAAVVAAYAAVATPPYDAGRPQQRLNARMLLSLRHTSRPSVVAAAAAAADGAAGTLAHTTGCPQQQAAAQTRAVLIVACLAMSLAAVHRVAFSVLAVPIQAQFGFSLPQMGMLQSALLAGYVLGQIPSGILADRLGGAHLAAGGLFLWSCVCAAFSHVPGSRQPFVALLAVRALLGLAQSCIMPAVSALSARWFPAASRSQYTSLVYSSFSVGTVAGLALTPLVAEHIGWGQTFSVFGLAGAAAAAACSLSLPPEGRAGGAASHQPPGIVAAAASAGADAYSGGSMGQEAWMHMLLLCFTHSIISWSFFIMQSWIPTLFASLGMVNLSSIGVFSALPWLATATVAVFAGSLADRLQVHHGWSTLRVRHCMQVVAMGGSAVSLLPLALPGAQLSPIAALAALTAAVAFQGFTYAGFHSYVQDVAPTEAGLVLAITNTCGTLVGIGGNLLTGWLAATQWGYAGIFMLTVVLQAASIFTWLAGAHGCRLSLA